MRISFSQLTKQGDRARNEDFIQVIAQNELYAFILCDGLGGHIGGAVASQCVCATMAKQLQTADGIPLQQALNEAILTAQAQLLREQEEQGLSHGLKTTLCCLAFRDGETAAAYVGDSRIYQFHENRVAGRTLDHSVVQYLVNIGELKESEIRHHIDRSRLLRVMGTEWEDPQYQIWQPPHPVGPGNAFLLCSDGFWEWIEEAKMEQLLAASASAADWLDQMQQVVLAQGAGHNMDNYSAIAIWIE